MKSTGIGADIKVEGDTTISNEITAGDSALWSTDAPVITSGSRSAS